jgi:hypothetical protein
LARQRALAKDTGEKFFSMFMAEVITEHDRVKIEYEWNKTFNNSTGLDYDKIPIAFSCAKNYPGNDKLEIRPEKREGVAFHGVTGSSLNAYGVGYGKANLLTSKILTPEGWVKMGDIQPGMFVIGKNGKPTKVLQIYPQGKMDAYRVTFSDGSFTEVTGDHLWHVKNIDDRNKQTKIGYRILQTKDMIGKLVNYRGNKVFSIPMVNPVEFTTKDVPVDPYLLGALLGDGGLTKGVTFSNPEIEIQDKIRVIVESYDLIFKRTKSSPKKDFAITRGNNQKKTNKVFEAIRDLGLLGKKSIDKFIPDIYLYNSIETRLAVLNGIMDTDGYVNKTGHLTQICTSSIRLAEGIIELVQSFGGTVNKAIKNPKYTYKGKLKKGHEAYVLTIRLPHDIIPFSTKKHLDRYLPKTKYQPIRFIDSIEPIGKHEAQCISVDAPDHLYVCDDYIVTHNTWVAIFIMAQSLDAGHCKRPFLVVPNQVYKQFYSEIKGILPHRKINDLYNLSKDYISQFIDENGEVFQVDEGSISMLTYQGLERLGFNETTQANMFDQLTDAISMLQDIDISTKKGAKDIVREKGKLEGIIGKALAKSTVKIEDFGFDFVCFDEAHALKKIFTQVKARKSEEGESKNKKMYEINAGIPSTRGIKGYFVCSYIQMLNKGNNVLLLTATPFTNSPLEVYSMLSLVAYTRMREMNLANINDFFDNFCQMSYELVINSKLQPERKQIFKGFDNLIGLQKLIYKYMLYKEAGKLDKKGNTIQLVRPDKWVLPYKGRFVGNDYISAKTDEYVDTVLPLTESQKSMMEEVIAYVEGNISYEQLSSKQSSSDVDNIDIDELITSILDENPELTRSQAEKQAEKYLNELQDEKLNISENSLDDEEKAGVRTLRGVNFARNISLSPYLYEFSGLGKPTYKTYIESSPKLTYIMKCIKSVKKWHENNKDAVSGQVIYMDRGKNHFELIKEYLIQELGYKEHEIGIIRSGKEGTSTHKDLIKNGFNGMVWNEALKSFEEMPDEKRIKIIIGTSSIREGMNLQKYSTVLYNAFVDWNPTDQLQLEGRVWRQGNTFKNVRIVLPLMSDSMDIFMFQKLEEKTSRINSIWNYDGQTNVLPIDELDPQEQKMALVTNPRVIAEMESERDVTKIEENISFHETNIQTANNVIDFMRTREKFDKDLTQIIERIASDKIGSSIEVKVKTFESALESGKVGDKSVKSLLYGINTYSNDFINYNGELKKPWNYGKMKGSVAMLKKAKEKFLDKYGIDESIGAVEFFIEGEQGKIKEIQEEIQRINSSEYLDNRASEIEQERKEKKIRFATVDERVAEFESLNHLLGIKREAEPVKSKKILETAKSECPPMTKDGMRDISKAGIRKLEACIKDIPDTKFMHIDADGNYTPERLKVHDRIIGKLRERAECVITNGKPPIAVLMGGVPGCFTANQLIVTADGVKPISEITPFDDVLSYNHETKKNEYRIVEKVHEFPTHQDRIIRIKMKDGTVIEVTENHEFYDGKEYVKIKDILKPIDVNNIL